MSLHVDDHHHDGGGDHPRMAMIAVAIILIFTCAAIFYMGNAYRVAPTHIIRQPLTNPL
ncbi:MAG: hypothetical protein K2X60_12640 [Xanthobacteraceae bacterium]|nr:hypothetical protein [Xanthobacteraceae bacterium]